MDVITVHAHFDGRQILLDEPIELQPGAKLLVTVISPAATERDEWVKYSTQFLSEAYSSDEPEYYRSLIKEINPKYEGS